MTSFNTPILFLIFNRPDTTGRVFSAIRAIQPKQLFIAADGPRENKIGEAELCQQTREIALKVDWPCEVKTLFQKENLGCGLGVVTAINWFFDNIEEGIVLEDDCLPDQSFFFFCQELLEKYRYNNKIMHISGNNFQNGKKRGGASYYFSEFSHNWGWATWTRAWKYNDFYSISPERQKHIWDNQWQASVKKQNGLAILPNVNLVTNIGFGGNATHTIENSPFSNIPSNTTVFPLIHPRKIKRDVFADIYSYRYVFGGKMRILIPHLFLQKIHKLVIATLNIIPKQIKQPIKNLLNAIKYSFTRLWGHSLKSNAGILLEYFFTNTNANNFKTIRNIPRFTESTIKLMGKDFKIADAPSFFSMYQEIIKSEIYKFKTDSKKPLIIDCGANIGVSVVYCKTQFPEASIIAFEPDPKLFDILKYNIQSFKYGDVQILDKALWSEETEIKFYSQGADGGHIANNDDKNNVITISTVKLSQYLNTRVDFLKLDIEGAEYEVLKECRHLLSNVLNLFVEYHSFSNQEQDLSELLNILKQAGFRYYIHPVYPLAPHPFEEKLLSAGMDMQANIYACRF